MDKQTEHYLLQQVELLTKRTNTLLRIHKDFYNEWDNFMDSNIHTIIKDIMD